jgi:ABC-type polysaccharide/polyol phosphate transport system ATPase subunit
MTEDIGFVIRYGEAVGIRGGNGTDASTPLKLLKRATLPSRGESSTVAA